MSLTSFMGGNAAQKIGGYTGVGELANGGTSVGGPAKPLVGKMNGGGAAGFIFNNFVQPFANSTSKLTADAAGLVGAGVNATHGKYGKQGMADAYLNSTPIAQAFNSQASNGLGKQLEAAAGDVGGDVLNVASPFVGGEAFAGAKGLGALLKTGAKVGAGLGGASGVANAAAQGGSAQDVAVGGLTGLGEGAVTGAAGGAVARGAQGASSLIGKLTGKGGAAAADVAGAGADAAAGNAQARGPFANAATNAGARAAQKETAQSSIDFSGDAENKANNIVGHDKQGQTVGIRQVQAYLRANGMPDDASGMQSLSNISQRTHSNDLQDMTSGINIDASKAQGVGAESVVRNVGEPRGVGASHANVAQRAIDNATSGLGPQSTVKEVLDARSQLESAKANAQTSASKGDLQSAGVVKSLQDTIDHLDSRLNSAGVNKAVAAHTVSPEGEARIRQIVAGEGGSSKLAQRIIDAQNNAQSYQDLISETQIPTLAGHLSKVARDTFSTSVPKVSKTTGQPQVPSWYLARAAAGDLPAAAAAASRLAENLGIRDRVLKAANPTAFHAGRTEALAPDAATQDKLDMPGVGGGPIATEGPQGASSTPILTDQSGASSMNGRRGNESAPPVSSNAAATRPRITKRPVAPPANLDNSLQQLGIRGPGGAPDQGVGDSITGPVQNSGGALGATGQAPQEIPTRVAQPAPSEPTTIPTRPMQTTNVPVTGQQTNANIPLYGPSVGERVAGAAGGVGDAIRNTAQAIGGAASRTSLRPGNLNALIGGLTGGGASQSGAPQTASTQPTGQADTTSIDQLSQTEDQLSNPQPTLDPSTIPGGTLQDLTAEIQADPKNATTYKDIYDEVQKEVTASAPQKLNATEAKNLTNIQNATAALNNYVQGLNSLSDSTRGAGVGQLSALLGKVGLGGANGNTAAQLESNKEELAIQLAQAMNNGNKPQGAQIEEIKKMLPSVGDPKALAARKIDQLSANLSDYLGIATSASVSNRNTGNTSSLLAGLTGGGQ